MEENNLNDSELNDDVSTEETEPLKDNEENNSSAEENSSPEEPAEGQKNDIGSDIIRGHINTIILRALYDRDKYGYEIMSDIEQKSHGQYTLKQPTLYSALKRLETQGYIKAYWKTDEVSSGGRRKYFTLTERGKDITEKNLAEWEYSRTIIDSLISDRSFDFSQPAPTPVDFTLLRDSVSRVPVVRSDEADRTAQDQAVTYQNLVQNTQPQTVIIQQTEYVQQPQQVIVQQPVEQTVTIEQPVQAPVQAEPQSVQPQPTPQEEARRIAHENYLRLISEPVAQQPESQHEDIVPNSENVNTDSLIYNNRPET
ncbi:MAG: PadR family transcriptional regulator [Clostridia bacterium]|nr:PadR family transcriptional regulator [Clostridia bacterium]